jgi:uncharacterized protein (TIGR03086 family)
MTDRPADPTNDETTGTVATNDAAASAADLSDIADRYDRLAADFAATVAAVPDDRWSAPSPCEEWTARDVVAHVVETHAMFEGMVGRDLGDAPAAEDDPAAAFAAARAAVSGHLHDPDAASATYDSPMLGTTTFANMIDRFISADLVVHRWDLGTAAGLDVRLPADEVVRIHEGLAGMGDAMRGPGAFGPAVEPPDDADDQDRLLAFLGRRA